jgi:hypothetical protein
MSLSESILDAQKDAEELILENEQSFNDNVDETNIICPILLQHNRANIETTQDLIAKNKQLDLLLLKGKFINITLVYK